MNSPIYKYANLAELLTHAEQVSALLPKEKRAIPPKPRELSPLSKAILEHSSDFTSDNNRYDIEALTKKISTLPVFSDIPFHKLKRQIKNRITEMKKKSILKRFKPREIKFATDNELREHGEFILQTLYNRKALRVAWSHLIPKEEAMNIAKLAAARAIADHDSKKGANVRTLMTTYIRNAMLNAVRGELRRRSRERTVSLDEPLSVTDERPLSSKVSTVENRDDPESTLPDVLYLHHNELISSRDALIWTLNKIYGHNGPILGVHFNLTRERIRQVNNCIDRLLKEESFD